MTANKPVSLYVRSCLDKKRKENKMTVKKEISKTLKNIGFLSNISFEKGIDVFFTLIAELQDKKFKYPASFLRKKNSYLFYCN